MKKKTNSLSYVCGTEVNEGERDWINARLARHFSKITDDFPAKKRYDSKENVILGLKTRIQFSYEILCESNWKTILQLICKTILVNIFISKDNSIYEEM